MVVREKEAFWLNPKSKIKSNGKEIKRRKKIRK